MGANARAASALYDRRLQVQRYLEVFRAVQAREGASTPAGAWSEQERS
jgi:hypothetical protein